jgi:hypothetical protein
LARHDGTILCRRKWARPEGSISRAPVHLTIGRRASGSGHDPDELLSFLKYPAIKATDLLAEHAIRFGVILRKVWDGSRTWACGRGRKRW